MCYGIGSRGRAGSRAKLRKIFRFLASEISKMHKKLLVYSFSKFHFLDHMIEERCQIFTLMYLNTCCSCSSEIPSLSKHSLYALI